MKSAEDALLNGIKDTFIFIRRARRMPFMYYGRVAAIRYHVEWEIGKLSYFIF